MPVWPFSASRERSDADFLLDQVTRASRNPALFGEGRLPDTLDGRFELISLHGALALVRLKRSPEAAPLAQAFVDAFFKHLDAGLREEGVGDLAVPKRMHKLAGAFYGRVEAYEAALAAREKEALMSALARNAAVTDGAFAAQLTDYVRRLAAAQADLPWQTLLNAEGWAAFVA